MMECCRAKCPDQYQWVFGFDILPEQSHTGGIPGCPPQKNASLAYWRYGFEAYRCSAIDNDRYLQPGELRKSPGSGSTRAYRGKQNKQAWERNAPQWYHRRGMLIFQIRRHMWYRN